MLAVAYSATFGGTITLFGTGSNLTFKGIYDEIFPGSGGMYFSSWIVLAAPQAILNCFLTWVYLMTFYMGMFRPDSEDAKHARLGPEGYAVAQRVFFTNFMIISGNFNDVLFFIYR